MKKSTKKTKKPRTVEFLPIEHLVREAKPIAQNILASGFGGAGEGDQGGGFNINAHVERMLGIRSDVAYLPDSNDASTLALRAYDGAFAIGIALGLLMRPEAFETRGAR